MNFVAAYTYDQAGQPAWHVISSCPLSGNSCTGDIYKVAGGTSPTSAWNGSGKVVTRVGSGTLTFANPNSGTFTFSIDGVTTSKAIVRQVFAASGPQSAIDYSDLWWNANESGWGVALTHQFGTIFATWYTYDATGNGIWWVASNCAMAGNGCSGSLYQVTGGSPLTTSWNGVNKVVTQIGTVSFAFSSADSGTMTYSINGLTGSKIITRQGF